MPAVTPPPEIRLRSRTTRLGDRDRTEGGQECRATTSGRPSLITFEQARGAEDQRAGADRGDVACALSRCRRRKASVSSIGHQRHLTATRPAHRSRRACGQSAKLVVGYDREAGVGRDRIERLPDHVQRWRLARAHKHLCGACGVELGDLGKDQDADVRPCLAMRCLLRVGSYPRRLMALGRNVKYRSIFCQ